MEMQQNELEQLLLSEQACKACEAQFLANPLDADNLAQWGKALLGLAQFQDGNECAAMLKEAMSKLEKALELAPNNHDAHWFMGNVCSSYGFCLEDFEAAKVYFHKATQCFKKAVEEDPGNEIYAKSLEMSFKAPELFLDIQKQFARQQAPLGGTSTKNTEASKKNKPGNDFAYDIMGWVILGVAFVVWIGFSKSHVPMPPPPPPL